MSLRGAFGGIVVNRFPADVTVGGFRLSRYARNTDSASTWCAFVNDWMASDAKPLVVVAKHVLTPGAAPMESPMWSKLGIFAKEASSSLSGPAMIKLGQR